MGMENLVVTPIGASLAREIAETEHYLHRKPPVSYAFGLQLLDRTVGVVTFGTPSSRHLLVGACPDCPGCVIELNRLWVHDDLGHNTESWFVSRALRALPAKIVVSYADTKHGHHGGVYRALNFRYAGWTDMERPLARLDYLAPSGGHTRDAFRNGLGRDSVKVRRQPKVRYWITTGTPAERRRLTKMCAWPDMDWTADPPPVEHISLAASRIPKETSP